MTVRSAMAMMTISAAMIPFSAGASYRDRDVHTAVVHIGDLDLASGWGVDRTIRRLRTAIDDLCDDDERCRDEAWLSADWQVARNVAAAQWRRRIADERSADRVRYGWRDDAPPMPAGQGGWADDASIGDVSPPPPPAAPIAQVTTTTTTTTTTTITLVYRTPPPDYGWYPH